MIEIQRLQKVYDGNRGLDGFDLRIEQGELFGIVGPNGAGKSTLIKILSTLLQPDGGSASVAGFDVASRPREVKRVIGYMPDQPGLYQDMRVREFLEFFSDAFHIPPHRRRTAVDEGIERAGLKARGEAFIEELSFGMKQRLFLAKTLLHDPKVLLLDEPATGLDPLARIELRKELRRLNEQGKTILLSSHILSDLEDICTRVALIAEGKNASDDLGQSVIAMRQLDSGQAPVERARVYEIGVLAESAAAAKSAEGVAGASVLDVAPRKLRVTIAGGEADAARLLKALVAAGVEVTSFAPDTGSLEESYRKAFGEKRQ